MGHVRSKMKWMIWVGTICISAVFARADVYFVRTVGDDANDGLSPTTAFATPAQAAGIAQAGDTIYVGGGVYNSSIVPINSGTSESPIRYIADSSGIQTGDGGAVVVQATGVPVVLLDAIAHTSFDGFIFRKGNGTVKVTNASSNITINNSVIEQSASDGILIDAGSSAVLSGTTITTPAGDSIELAASGEVVIRNCQIEVPQGYGIYAQTNGDITIANCVFNRTPISGHAIWVMPTNKITPTSVTITGNDLTVKNELYLSSGYQNGWRATWTTESTGVVRRIRFSYGIIVLGWGSPMVSRVEVSNNIVSDSFLGIFAGIYSQNSRASESIIANNTVTGSFFSIYSFGYKANSIAVVNNIVDTCFLGLIAYSNQSITSIVEGTLEHNITYNMAGFFRSFEERIIKSEPRFVNPKIGDFSLMRGSMGIDRGVTYNAPMVDIGGRPRPVDGNNDGIAQIDIGAFELVGKSTRIRMVQWSEVEPVNRKKGGGSRKGFAHDHGQGGASKPAKKR